MTGSVHAPAFDPGDGIAWRNCPRDAARVERPSYVVAMTVVHDTPDELALFRRPGHRMWRRKAELGGPTAFRHRKVIRFLDGWIEDPIWSRWRVLVLKRPQSEHAISLFWDDASDRLDFWSIDLIGPVRRRTFGFDFPEHGLDIVVEPDLSSWRRKDEDELEWDVAQGIYTRRGGRVASRGRPRGRRAAPRSRCLRALDRVASRSCVAERRIA